MGARSPERRNNVTCGLRGPGRGPQTLLCTPPRTHVRPMHYSAQRKARIWRVQGPDPWSQHITNVFDGSHDAECAQKEDLQGSGSVLQHLVEIDNSGRMGCRPAARLRWTPACRRACATSEGGGSAECSPAESRAASDGTWMLGKESRGDEGSCLRGRLPGPRRRLTGRRLSTLASSIFYPGWLIGLQTRIPLRRWGGHRPLRWALRDRR